MSEFQRARTDEQKRLIVEAIYKSWCNIPQLRLGQAIDNALKGAMPLGPRPDLFYVEDTLLVDLMREFAGR